MVQKEEFTNFSLFSKTLQICEMQNYKITKMQNYKKLQ